MATLVITPEMQEAAEKIAKATGTTPQEAFANAIRERLNYFESRRHSREIDWAAIREIQQRVAGTIDYSKSEDEILGYDDRGIPEQPTHGD